MWAGHPTSNRVNRVADFGPVFFENFAEFLRRVLRLGDCHAVTRDENDVTRGFEHVVGVLDGDAFHLAFDRLACLPASSAKASEEDVDQGAVHRFAHNDGQNQP